jgi:Uma2 family endonuclease
VISPNELYSEVEEKVDEYLAAGVRLVWVIDPPHRSVRIHRADGTVTDLHESDELSGEAVVPGFCCPVAELFHPPVAAAPE